MLDAGAIKLGNSVTAGILDDAQRSLAKSAVTRF